MKKRNKKYHSHKKLKESCIENKDQVFLPKSNTRYKSFDTNSWFDIKHTDYKKTVKQKQISSYNETYYTRKFILKPTIHQKNILNNWFNATTHVYNYALKHIKQKEFYKSNDKPSFISIRNSIKSVKSNYKDVRSHILDLSIKKAVENYKSALSNFRNKNIKSFRIRYHKKTLNTNKTVYIEPCYVLKKGNISDLGDLDLYDVTNYKKYKINKEDIKSNFEIKYNHKENKYYVILIYKRLLDNKEEIKEDYISLDPGVSPFLTGVSKENSCFIGENGYNMSKNYFDKIDKTENSDIKNKKKKKHISKLRNKLRNKIEDLHWKTINYLTNNYNRILIGDLSVKGIVEKSGIVKKSKRILHSYRLYIFKERLKLRCEEKNIKYEEINEYLTTKSCSLCGEIKDDLGKRKKYECNTCGNKIHRDINGARGIYFVSCIG